MSYLNTELMKALLKNDSVDEFFRQQLETAINDLLQAEITAFLGYEKYNSKGWGSGNSRNGFYDRAFDTKYGKLNLHIPRDRKGEFEQQLIPDYARRSDTLETTVIQLYRKGITTTSSKRCMVITTPLPLCPTSRKRSRSRLKNSTIAKWSIVMPSSTVTLPIFVCAGTPLPRRHFMSFWALRPMARKKCWTMPYTRRNLPETMQIC